MIGEPDPERRASRRSGWPEKGLRGASCDGAGDAGGEVVGDL